MVTNRGSAPPRSVEVAEVKGTPTKDRYSTLKHLLGYPELLTHNNFRGT